MQIKQLYVHTTSAHRRGAGFFIPMLLAHVFHKHRQVSRLYKSHKSLWSDPLHTACCVSGFNYIVCVHRLLDRNEGIMFTISWNPEETKMQMCFSSHCIRKVNHTRTTSLQRALHHPDDSPCLRAAALKFHLSLHFHRISRQFEAAQIGAFQKR